MRRGPQLRLLRDAQPAARPLGDEALDKVRACAELDIPLVYAPAPAAGTTAPASMTATIVVGNAETLSGLVVHQLTRSGAPFVYGVGCGAFDMRTAVDVYGAPEHFLGNAAATDLARFYGLPSFAYAAVADAKSFDEQWAAEAGITAVLGALSRATLLHDVGYLESGLQSSYETIVLGDELVGYARALLVEVGVDDEALALNEIDAVGPGGSHLGRGYTRRHHRETWQPRLFDRATHDRWAAAGATRSRSAWPRARRSCATSRARSRWSRRSATGCRPCSPRQKGAAGDRADDRDGAAGAPDPDDARRASRCACSSDDDVARVHAAALELLGAEGAAAEAAAQSAPRQLRPRRPRAGARRGARRRPGVAGGRRRDRRARRRPERVRRLAGGDPVPATAADLDDAVPARRRAARGGRARRPAAARRRRARARRARALLRRHQQARDGRGLCDGRRGRGAPSRWRRPSPAPPARRAAARRSRSAAAPTRCDAALVFARAGLPVGVVLAPADAASEPAAVAPRRRRDAPRHRPRRRPHPPPRRRARRLRGRPGRGPRRAVLLRRRPRGRRPARCRPVRPLFQLAAAQLAAHVGPAARRRRPAHGQPRARLAGLHSRTRSPRSARPPRGADVTGGAGTARRRHRLQPPAAGHGHRDLQLEREDRRRASTSTTRRSPSTPSSRSASAATTWASATRAGT